MMALQFICNDPKEIVIAAGDSNPSDFISYFRTSFIPSKVLLLHSTEKDRDLNELAPFMQSQPAIKNKTTVYICRNYSCEKPVFDINDVKNI